MLSHTIRGHEAVSERLRSVSYMQTDASSTKRTTDFCSSNVGKVGRGGWPT